MLLTHQLLMSLYDSPQRSAKTLGEKLGVPTSRALWGLKKLQERGWAERGGKGRYGYTWCLTEVGFVAAEAAFEKHFGGES
jgi:DNA-binding IclR family transcriptional regulator